MVVEYQKKKKLVDSPTPSFYGWRTEARAEGFAYLQSLAG